MFIQWCGSESASGFESEIKLWIHIPVLIIKKQVLSSGIGCGSSWTNGNLNDWHWSFWPLNRIKIRNRGCYVLSSLISAQVNWAIIRWMNDYCIISSLIARESIIYSLITRRNKVNGSRINCDQPVSLALIMNNMYR